jgi:L-amino acid N-acyltransferase YncA
MLAAASLLTPAALTVRPIGPADREALQTAFLRLSPASRYSRFLAPKASLSPDELTYFTEVDHRRHEALVALAPDDGRIAAVARYAPAAADGVADFSIVVEDGQQGRGIGTTLGFRLVGLAAGNGVRTLTASTLTGNRAARTLLARLGFRVLGLDHGVVEAELRLAW